MKSREWIEKLEAEYAGVNHLKPADSDYSNFLSVDDAIEYSTRCRDGSKWFGLNAAPDYTPQSWDCDNKARALVNHICLDRHDSGKATPVCTGKAQDHMRKGEPFAMHAYVIFYDGEEIHAIDPRNSEIVELDRVYQIGML